MMSRYAVIALLSALAAGAFVVRDTRRQQLKASVPWVYLISCAVLALLCGRAVYAFVRSYDVFYDVMGEYIGIGAFFDAARGGLSVTGVITGILLAAFLCGRAFRLPPRTLLNLSALPGLGLYALLRLTEPLTGQGYGVFTDIPVFFNPVLGISFGGNSWAVSVSFLEAALAALILILLARKRPQEAGLAALALLAVSQILPESLRRDDVLRVFIFARLNQLFWAALWFCCMIPAWHALRNRKKVLKDLICSLAGIALLVGCEYALDKTPLSHFLIYLVMGTILAAGGALAYLRMKNRRKPE